MVAAVNGAANIGESANTPEGISGGPCAATPAKKLREQILNPCVPKNEREWWAARTIDELLTEGGALLAAAERHIFGDECLAERDAFRAAIAKAKGP